MTLTNSHLTRSGWVPVVNKTTVPHLLPTKALALKEAKRIGALVGVDDVSTEPFSYTITQEQYESLLRPYVSEDDMPSIKNLTKE